jgi:protocatechuate 3,4-dioxygenase beta subunit
MAISNPHLRAALCVALALALLSGRVLDATTGQPLAGIRISAVGPTRATTTTDRAGRFTFTTLKPGRYRITARSRAVPPQSVHRTLRAGKPLNIRLHVCSTTLDYHCGGGGVPGGGGAG